jgi:hypothetical protein
MMFTSLLPIGLFQFHASVSEGLWYARSEAFLQQPFLQTLRWVRTFGDVVFIVGALCVSWQVVRGLFGTPAPAARPRPCWRKACDADRQVQAPAWRHQAPHRRVRDLARAGADTHAEAIAQGIVAMSALIGCTWRWRTRCCTRRCRPTARAIWPGWRGTTRATWCRSPRPTTRLRGAGTPASACADAKASATTPTWCCASCTNACCDREFYPQIEAQELAGALKRLV